MCPSPRPSPRLRGEGTIGAPHPRMLQGETLGAAPIPLAGPVGKLEGAAWDAEGYRGTPALRFDGRAAAFSIAPEQVAMRPAEMAVELRLKTPGLLHKQNVVIGQYEGPRHPARPRTSRRPARPPPRRPRRGNRDLSTSSGLRR